MGQFKPMVKMFTNEPSVILKLKKGGKVAHKADGFKTMHKMSESSMFEAAEHGKSPKKPSMAARRRAMNPQFKKGGKVAHREMGGGMPMAAPMARAPMAAMGRAKLAKMAPAVQAARLAQVRKALTGMKKGGSAADCAALERELKHHESMSAKRAHGKASGGAITASMAKTTVKNSVKPYAKTKVVDGDKKDKAHGTGEVKEGKPGGYKMGGTIEGNEGEYENTKVVDGDHNDPAHGTGGVRMGNSGGFKKGGKIVRKASGGNMFFPGSSAVTPMTGVTAVTPAQQAAFQASGMGTPQASTPSNIMGSAATPAQQAAFQASSMYTAPTEEQKNRFSSMSSSPTDAQQAAYQASMSKPVEEPKTSFNQMFTPPTQKQQDDFSSSFMSPTQMRSDQQAPDTFYRKNSFTKGLGYKTGGNVKGNWENRPANTAKAGVKNTSTGEVKESNAGGYKRGGSAKKAYATGGNVVDDGKAEKMPRHFKSQPVANSLQSGTFKRGGKVRKSRAYGGSC
jgi:hypothetical protein